MTVQELIEALAHHHAHSKVKISISVWDEDNFENVTEERDAAHVYYSPLAEAVVITGD